MKLRRTVVCGVASVLAVAMSGCAGGAAAPASVEAGEDYYAGKTITWIVAASPGGGGDNLARAYAPFLEEYLPGDQQIVFEYMEGGGGVEAVNYMVNVADQDGLTISTATQDSFISQLLGSDGVQYTFQDLTFLGNFTQDDQMLIARSDFGVRTFDEFLAAGKPMRSGARSAAHPVARVPLVIDAIFDPPLFEMTYGYSGGSDVTLDVERGALDGRSVSVGSLNSTNPEWIADDFVVPLVYAGRERHPDFPDVPTLIEVTPQDKQALLGLIFDLEVVSRSLVTTPELPQGAQQQLEAAFSAMAADPAVEAAVNDLGFEFTANSGEDIAAAVAAVADNQQTIDALRQIVGS